MARPAAARAHRWTRDHREARGASARQILEVASWPDYKGLVVVFGRQHDLSGALTELFCGGRWSVKKGGLWWVTNRVRREQAQVVVRAVISPDLLRALKTGITSADMI